MITVSHVWKSARSLEDTYFFAQDPISVCCNQQHRVLDDSIILKKKKDSNITNGKQGVFTPHTSVHVG